MFPSKSYMSWWKEYHQANLFQTFIQAAYFTALNIVFSAQQSVQRICRWAREK